MDDYYNDAREGQEEYYTIEYFENFKDPTTGVVTGRYKAYQYKKGEETEIKGVMYDHDGYTIVGWLENETDVYYKVGSKYTGNVGNLKLYAVWKLNGYLVTFNANVKEGDSYRGETASITAQYNETKQFPENGYEYPGYIFKYWSDKEGTKQYRPGDEFKNLSLVNDTTVTLYAQWEECKHDPSAEYPATFTYTSSGNVITLNCSCKAFSETATVKAENTTYDTHEHSAHVVYSGSNWGLEISYLKDDVSIDHDPTNAGSYKAQIECGGKMAFIEYTISKAKLQRPSKPIISVNETTLTVTPVGNEPVANIEPKYQLKYYIGEEPDEISWSDNTSYVLNNAYTSYYIEVYYPESENYKASAIIMSDATYYIGKVEITVVCDDNIDYQLVQPSEDELIQTGLTISVSAKPGYYLTSQFSFSTNCEKGGNPWECTVRPIVIREEYLISNIPDGSKLEITISGASLQTTITATVQKGQIFSGVQGASSATITNDAAFTSFFTLSNYDSGAYEGLSLEFGTALPVGTTVIMAENGRYWYYRVSESPVTKILLSDMKAMGRSDLLYSGISDSYLFVVDFSQVVSKPEPGELTTTLAANKADDADECVPDFGDVCPELTVELTEAKINVKHDALPGLEQRLTVTLKSDAYSGKAAALVLRNKTEVLPIDAYFKVVNGGLTTDIYRNAQGDFIIPIIEVNAQASITLCSSIFPLAEVEYDFEVLCFTSQSALGGAPVNGTQHGEAITVNFGKEAVPTPSLAVSGTQRVFTSADTIELNINGLYLDDCRVNAAMMFKSFGEGAYTATAYNPEVELVKDPESNTWNATFSLGLNQYGTDYHNYCLMFRVTDANGNVLCEVPYYFIVQ